MEVIYRADDGTIFEEEIDCQEYENVQRMKNSKLYLCKVWNSDFQPVEISITDPHWVDFGYYYYAPTAEAKADMNELFDYFGFCAAPFENDSFSNPDNCFAIWDNHNDCFADFEEEYYKMKRLREKLFKILSECHDKN